MDAIENENERIVREAAAAVAKRDLDAISRLIAEDAVAHVPGSNHISGDYVGREEFVDGLLRKILAITEEFEPRPHDILASSEHAVGLFRFRAVRDGRAFEWQQVNVWHVRDGRLTELWLFPGDFENWNAFWS